jgi:hypothetical protein
MATPPYSCDESKPVDPDSKVKDTRSMKKRNIKVVFTEMVTVTHVLHLEDFTDEEFKASFYDITELESIKTELNLTAELVEVGDLHNDISEYCRRGTEYRTGQGARRRISNKHVGRDAVLDEQDVQWEDGVFDPDAIAGIYAAATWRCQIEVHRLALQDEKEAQEIHLEATDLWRPFDKLETGRRMHAPHIQRKSAFRIFYYQ